MTNCRRASARATRSAGPRVWLAALLVLLAGAAQAASYPQNPLVFDGAIYVSHEGVYRFDDGRNEPRWQALTGIETFSLAVHRNMLLVGSTRGLYALERESGEVRWHAEPSRTLFTPTLARDAYAGSLHGELYAIDPESGAIRWRRSFAGWIYSPAIGADGESLWTGGQMHALIGLDAGDGFERRRIDTRAESVFSPLDLGDGRAAFNLFDGSTRFVDMASGATLAEIPGAAQPSGLERDGEQIFRVDRAGHLDVIDIASLARLRQIDFDTQDLALHPSRDGALLVSDIDRNLWLLDTNARAESCRLRPTGRWLKPLQRDANEIIYFEKGWNPPGLTPVVHFAQCNQNQGSSK